MTSDYESVLPKVFYALGETERGAAAEVVAICAIEWGVCRLEECGWSPEQIRAHIRLLLDPTPPEGSA
jgi:hypothetical protein